MNKQIKRAKLIGKPKKLRSIKPPEEDKLLIDREGNIIGSLSADEPEERSQKDGEEHDTESGDSESGMSRKMRQETQLTAEERELKESTEISEDFDRLKRQLEEQVGLNKSFDVIFREMVFGGQKTGIFYYNGFIKDYVLTEILERLSYADQVQRETEHRKPVEEHRRPYRNWRTDRAEEPSERQEEDGRRKIIGLFEEALIPHVQVKRACKLKEAIDNVAMGGTAFFFEGEREAILVDAKSFPARTTEEPELERVVRGSRDGFVETLLTNVTLVRRRVRDPRLKLEITQVGKRTQTDVCIGYIQDICDMKLVESIRDKIKEVKVDGVPLAEKQLEEAVVGNSWNPYPSVRYSERPDVVAAHLLEGHVIVFVDTSPSVMILPTTFFHHVQHAEEYRQTPIVGTYLRWVRFIGIAASIFLLPLWLLIVTTPELKPAGLEFLGPQKPGKIPIIGQFLIAELGIDLMRMAAVHTPSPLAIAMGLVAAILVGEVAVKAGLFSNEIILYISVAAVGTFATPSYELSLANRICRLVLLVISAVFKVPGFVIGSTFLLLMLALQRSYNTPYLWPFIPFNMNAMRHILIRVPFLSMKTRLSLTRPKDRTRQAQRPK
ncbi:stage V sporulation protein AF [Paenibacillus elgii]|uniref:Stage V sporulation protein AF n=1 Tax=Paenibacillus elgii TaxID=189691 RepID=A0A163V1C5_9BACL|nr:spore germination protein [Paenibacillus elgii]KZE74181.1 stage V sporulation protein AF [Paenibacillus elgii]